MSSNTLKLLQYLHEIFLKAGSFLGRSLDRVFEVSYLILQGLSFTHKIKNGYSVFLHFDLEFSTKEYMSHNTMQATILDWVWVCGVCVCVCTCVCVCACVCVCVCVCGVEAEWVGQKGDRSAANRSGIQKSEITAFAWLQV